MSARLRTVMERAVVLCEGDEVRASHILFDAPGSPEAGAGDAGSPEAGNGDAGERERILAALDASAGNQTSAARMLGMSRTTLVHKLDVHRLPRPAQARQMTRRRLGWRSRPPWQRREARGVPRQ